MSISMNTQTHQASTLREFLRSRLPEIKPRPDQNSVCLIEIHSYLRACKIIQGQQRSWNNQLRRTEVQIHQSENGMKIKGKILHLLPQLKSFVMTYCQTHPPRTLGRPLTHLTLGKRYP